jgi:NitT/TauT family transport system permease protein
MVGSSELEAAVEGGQRRAWLTWRPRWQLAALDPFVPLLSLAALLGFWELASYLLSIPRYLVPRPSEIGAAIVAERQALLNHGRLTAIEMLAGFALGSAFSLAFGLLVVYWPPAKRLFMPYMVVLKATPKVALAPLFVIWFGFGIKTNIIYTALIAFFPVLVNFIQGLEDVRTGEARLMASLNASTWQTFRQVHLYRSLPYLFAGLKMAAVLALIGAVVSEFVAGDGGLGYYMVQMQNVLKTTEAFAALVVLALMGLTFYAALDGLQRLLMPWAQHTEVGSQDVV